MMSGETISITRACRLFVCVVVKCRPTMESNHHVIQGSLKPAYQTPYLKLRSDLKLNRMPEIQRVYLSASEPIK
jgi:hypothetical protein